ncbi:MAG TPA: hypothetical protein VMT62_02990, partial [Syntrophorhabdaceae bacterium]|nr:hypothetical protein [Syntrophorhabdaceae bacterium]
LGAQGELLANDVIVQSIGGHQHDTRTENKTMRQSTRTGDTMQVLALLIGEHDGTSGTAVSHGFPP